MTEVFNSSPFSVPPSHLLLAFLLDLAIGDPRWLPHPVRIIGRVITRVEGFLRRHCTTPRREKWAGLFLALSIVLPVLVFTSVFCAAIEGLREDPFFNVAGAIILVYLISTTIAARELVCASRLVIESIKKGSLETARRDVSMIVGRDTANLSEKGVLKATVETLAENLSDGVIAPLFYLALGGLPLAMAYKAINTLDSMVGYKNERYLHLGRASARLDDLANYIPARITGILISAASFFHFRSLFTLHSSLKTMLRDGRNHASPNSGIPEASMAGALGIRLGGPSTYGGMLVKKPYIGEEKTEDYLSASERAIAIVKTATMIGLGVAALTASMRAWP